MSSLAIPAAPPTSTVANAPGAAAPATSEGKFGDALRQTRAQPETQAYGHAAADTPASRHASEKPDAGDKDQAEDDQHAGKKSDAKTDDPAADAAVALPTMTPVVPLATATLRQTPAASGKPLPATTQPAAVAGNVAAAAAATPEPMVAVAANNIAPPATAKGTAPGALADNVAHAVRANAPNKVDAGPIDAHADATKDSNFADILRMPAHTAAPQADANLGNETMPARQGPADFSAQLTQLVGVHLAQPGNAAPTPAPLQLAMQATPDQQPQFTQETAQNVAWLAGKGIDKAEIQLNPRTLGPIHVEISTHNDRVDVSFAVAHPQTVHALQQTLPHLNDMLAQQGLNLGQASVGQRSPGQQHAAFAQQLGGNIGSNTNNAEIEAPQNWRPLRIATPGRVDDFA